MGIITRNKWYFVAFGTIFLLSIIAAALGGCWEDAHSPQCVNCGGPISAQVLFGGSAIIVFHLVITKLAKKKK